MLTFCIYYTYNIVKVFTSKIKAIELILIFIQRVFKWRFSIYYYLSLSHWTAMFVKSENELNRFYLRIWWSLEENSPTLWEIISCFQASISPTEYAVHKCGLPKETTIALTAAIMISILFVYILRKGTIGRYFLWNKILYFETSRIILLTINILTRFVHCTF